MKRIWKFVLLVLAAVLVPSGCGKLEPESVDNLLNFPKTQWGMTPQETLDAYHLSMEDVTIRTAPEVFSENESRFFTAFCLETKEEREVLGEKMRLSFYFADLTVSSRVEDTLGLFYVEGSFRTESMEERTRMQEQIAALSAPSDDPRVAGQSGLYVGELNSAEAVTQFCELRQLDNSRILTDPLVTIYLYGTADASEEMTDTLRWYGLNAALGQYLEEFPDPLEQYQTS